MAQCSKCGSQLGTGDYNALCFYCRAKIEDQRMTYTKREGDTMKREIDNLRSELSQQTKRFDDLCAQSTNEMSAVLEELAQVKRERDALFAIFDELAFYFATENQKIPTRMVSKISECIERANAIRVCAENTEETNAE